ncbi:MAG: class I poly(R)-hydroxyalkanoic acid synthase, partial [Pseudomonadota bacterium]
MNDDDFKPSEKLAANLERVDQLTKRLLTALSEKKEPTPQALQGPSQELFMRAASAYMAEMMANP